MQQQNLSLTLYTCSSRTFHWPCTHAAAEPVTDLVHMQQQNLSLTFFFGFLRTHPKWAGRKSGFVDSWYNPPPPPPPPPQSLSSLFFSFFHIPGFDVVYVQQQNPFLLTSFQPPQNSSKDGLRGVVLLMAYTVHILPFHPPIMPIFFLFFFFDLVCVQQLNWKWFCWWLIQFTSPHPPPSTSGQCHFFITQICNDGGYYYLRKPWARGWRKLVSHHRGCL